MGPQSEELDRLPYSGQRKNLPQLGQQIIIVLRVIKNQLLNSLVAM
jgi:hypothetical protein